MTDRTCGADCACTDAHAREHEWQQNAAVRVYAATGHSIAAVVERRLEEARAHAAKLARPRYLGARDLFPHAEERP